MTLVSRRIAILLAGGVTCLLLPGLALGEPALPDVRRLESSPVLRHLRPNPVASAPKTGAGGTLTQMYVPQGFHVDLIASEPEVHQPIAFAWDARGRIWLAEAYSYPQKQPKGQGKDRILILEDADGDGRFEKIKVFADKLNLVSGLEVGYGGVWVGAAPELLFIPDRNEDDVPDGAPETLLDGFGYQDTHECLNSFLWGPDGWLYGNQGVFNLAHIGKPGAPDAARTELRAGVWRYHPVRHEFEVFAHGGSNPWGLDYDEAGQMFMTHCRSYFGGGCTTHVIQGGHFWNQANANYAPFIIPDAPEGFPGFRNYLLASARYDHGAGGAGVRGSDAIYGGHSHVGTMIYLGDNWPAEFRGHLFTHNLGGHQINHQVNRRLGSGFETVHAGQDQFFCTDPAYVPVDLQYGPDGAVYMIDWYDIQHCHNPAVEKWDRGNGRVYRMSYSATYKPRPVDLRRSSDLELAGLQNHGNQWFARMSRRLLHERSIQRPIEKPAADLLRSMSSDAKASATVRLGALWTMNLIGDLTEPRLEGFLGDTSEYVRAWAVQLAVERAPSAVRFAPRLEEHASSDPSAVVRLYLASAIQRLPAASAWNVAQSLALRSEDVADRNIPALIWHGMAPLVQVNRAPALQIARQTRLSGLGDWILWYAAMRSEAGMAAVVGELGTADAADLPRRLAGLVLALAGSPTAPMPPTWRSISGRLAASTNLQVRQEVEFLAGTFGDRSGFPELRRTLAAKDAPRPQRDHALRILSRAQDDASLGVFIGLLGDAAFRGRILPLLGRFSAPAVGDALIQGMAGWNDAERAAALGALTSRGEFATQLLKAVSENRVKRDWVTAFHVRQMVGFKDPAVDAWIAKLWGRVGQTSAEKREQIARLEKTFNEAPLWAYDGSAGRGHYQKLCAPCHRLGNDGARIGPELTGAGRHGVRYLLENIVDPNSVVGTDFQMTSIETREGETLSGIVVARAGDSITVRTVSGQRVLPRSEVQKEQVSENSLMPEGLLESLTAREQIELLKFLADN